ncbi:histone deacetylase HosA [Reticulomyxa filosa]|uniref:Histone deacetylase HosA n=1 Tax=Reticulomyxa filosa TaxID=46433 RepID=X6M6J5_RETFI|nr:histone deacetylase HosA [Reticulomyxa filosa]|eukprot:ETO09529.1 histone deacetylase HosA [Reticulomyxa filosa]
METSPKKFQEHVLDEQSFKEVQTPFLPILADILTLFGFSSFPHFEVETKFEDNVFLLFFYLPHSKEKPLITFQNVTSSSPATNIKVTPLSKRTNSSSQHKDNTLSLLLNPPQKWTQCIPILICSDAYTQICDLTTISFFFFLIGLKFQNFDWVTFFLFCFTLLFSMFTFVSIVLNMPMTSRLFWSLVKAYELDQRPDLLKVMDYKACTTEELLAYHQEDYVTMLEESEQLLEYCECNDDERQLLKMYGLLDDCSPFEGLYEYCLAVAGSSIEAARCIHRGERLVLNFGGGRHHAKSQKASGFCFVNDIVLLIDTLREHKDYKVIEIWPNFF